MEKKKTKKELKLEKKNKKWKEKYGVLYTECLPQKEVINGKTKSVNYTKKILVNFKKYKSRYIVFFLMGLLIAGISLVAPICWEKIINNLTSGNFENIIYLAIIICGYQIVVAILKYFMNNLINTTYHKMIYDLRYKLTQSTISTKISKFDKTATGDILNRIDDSSNEFSSALVCVISYLPEILGNLVFVGYGLYVNVWLGLIMLAVGFVPFIIKVIYMNHFHSVYQKRNYQIFDKDMSQHTELVKGIRDIKNLNAQNYTLKNINTTMKNVYNANVDNAVNYQKMYQLQEIVKAFLLFGFLALGIYFITIGTVTVGAMLVLLLYRSEFFALFDNLAEWKKSSVDLKIHSERMYQVLNDKDYPKEKFGKKVIKNSKGKIEFKNVDFSYDDKKLLFNTLNLVIQPNECVGFVGQSGQGKSTLINLITKFYETNNGEVLIDGININDLTENSLRGNISVVPQSPYIFNLSVKDNLLLANPKASDKEIQLACKKAYIDDFINSLPEKYDTIVGEGGVTLSGGQKQRIAIARAFLKPCKILLFDEATSAIDNESQAKIFASIEEFRKNHTVVIIAHRLSTIKNCDKIFVIDKHKIVDVGTHKDLIKKSTIYKNLYNTEAK